MLSAEPAHPWVSRGGVKLAAALDYFQFDPAGRVCLDVGASTGGFTEVLGPGRVLTAAAGANEVAYENEGFGRSYMVEYMVRRAMLQGKAAGSVQDAFAWARAQIAHDYPNRQPIIIDRSRGPVVLGRTVAATPENRRPAAPQPPAHSQDPQPAPNAPPPTAPDPKPGGACAEVLGVSVCSQQHSRGPRLPM